MIKEANLCDVKRNKCLDGSNSARLVAQFSQPNGCEYYNPDNGGGGGPKQVITKFYRSISMSNAKSNEVDDYEMCSNSSLGSLNSNESMTCLETLSAEEKPVKPTIDINQLVRVDFALNRLFESSPEKTPADELKEKKKPKWRDATQELCMFRTKASANYAYYSDPQNPIEETFSSEPVAEVEESDLEFWAPDFYVDETVSSYFSKKFSKYFNNIFPYAPDRSQNFGCVRRKQANKRTKLKTAVRRNDLKRIATLHGESNDSFKRLELSKQALKKGNARLHLKYNIVARLGDMYQQAYVTPLKRCKHVYGVKKIDKRSHVVRDVLEKSKRLFKYEGGVRKQHAVDSVPPNSADPSSVIQHSALDRHQLNAELNQNYDDLYVEFLISLQHREITPEDYEYLSRLDELVKKKTVNESVLSKLKVEPITTELLVELEKDQEVCGICLDPYGVGQTRKHLPCGHKFHSDCIDAWLKSQSNICPLDKRPVDEAPQTQISRAQSRLATQQSWMIGLDAEDLSFLLLGSVSAEQTAASETDQGIVRDLIGCIIDQIEALS